MNNARVAVCRHLIDVDGDGEVGFLDLIEILTDWGPCPGCGADLDGNGSVDNGDLIRVLASWGGC